MTWSSGTSKVTSARLNMSHVKITRDVGTPRSFMVFTQVGHSTMFTDAGLVDVFSYVCIFLKAQEFYKDGKKMHTGTMVSVTQSVSYCTGTEYTPKTWRLCISVNYLMEIHD